jgi:hypothetical protein
MTADQDGLSVLFVQYSRGECLGIGRSYIISTSLGDALMGDREESVKFIDSE